VFNTVGMAALAGLMTRFLFAKAHRGKTLPSFITVGVLLFGAVCATGIYKEAVKLKTGDELRRPPFLAMRVLADGPGKAYLQTACAHGSPYALCAFKALPLDNSQDLLWSDDRKKGIFNVTTIDNRLMIENQENEFVLKAVAAHPLWQIWESTLNWGQQLGMWYVDDPIKNPHYYLTNDYWSTTNLPMLINSAKNCGRDHWGCGFKLSIDGSTWLHGILLLLGLGAILWRIAQADILDGVLRREIDWDSDAGRLFVTLTLLVGVVLINAFVCGALSGPFPRYQARITWLVSEGAAVALISMAPMFATLRPRDGLAWVSNLIERLRRTPVVMRVTSRLDADFFRFALVGVAGFTVDYAVLHCLVAFAGLNPFVARFISFPVAVVATWLLNRSFTFCHAQAHGPVRQAVYYVAVQGAGGVANIAVYSAAIALFPVLRNYLPLALALGSATGLCVTFAGSKYIAFRRADMVEVEPVEAVEAG